MFWTEGLGNESDPKVLVACPTYSGMGYSLKRWADAYHAQTYKNKGALQVDNSDGPMSGGNLHYSHLIRAQGIPAIWQTVRFPALWDTLELSWKTMVEYAHAHDYKFIFSVEADVIVPPDALQKMLDCAYKNATGGLPAVVTQRYHPRGQEGPNFWWDTLGCSLFPVEPLWKDIDLIKSIYEIEVFNVLERHGYKRIRPGHDCPDLFEVTHLKDPDDPYVHVTGASAAPTKYLRRVMEANGMKLNGESAVLTKSEDAPTIPMGKEATLEPEDPPNGAVLGRPYGGRREADDRAKPLGLIDNEEDAIEVLKDDRIRLNIGSDITQIAGFLSVDFNPKVNPDVLAEADKLPMFDDDSVDEIYASHVLEHLPYESKALEEWLRVLKPGGMLTVAVPNIVEIYSLYKHGSTWGEYHMPIDEVYVNATAFGANLLADAIPEMKDLYGGPGHKHQQIFLFDMLLNRVLAAGFVYASEVRKCFLRPCALGETMVQAQKPREGE